MVGMRCDEMTAGVWCSVTSGAGSLRVLIRLRDTTFMHDAHRASNSLATPGHTSLLNSS